MTRRRVLVVATVQSHVAQFHQPLIRMLKAMGVDVDVAARNNLESKRDLAIEGADRVFDLPFSRSPLRSTNLAAAAQLRRILKHTRYDVIHCNTPVGGAVARLVGLTIRHRPQVVYTAHGFHFYRGARIFNWFTYFPAEWLLSMVTDVLVTISVEDFKFARRWMPTHVERISGVGGDSGRFSVNGSLPQDNLRGPLGIPSDAFVTLSVGELNGNKNQQLLIRAVSDLSDMGRPVHAILAGNGPLEEELRRLAEDLGVADRIHFLGYRRDVNVLMREVDVLVSSSRREGLPMNIVEAMMSGVPVVASSNRGHRELVSNGVSGLLFNPHAVDNLKDCLLQISDSPSVGLNLTQNALEVSTQYTDKNVYRQLGSIYQRILGSIGSA